jgi:hypothetical protein
MIAYKHLRDETKATLAVDLPKLPVLINTINGFSPSISAKLGITLLHHQDEFCKRVGREKALKNLKSVSLDFAYMTILGGKRKIYAFTFETESPIGEKIYGEIEFSEVINSSSVHLENVYLNVMPGNT